MRTKIGKTYAYGERSFFGQASWEALLISSAKAWIGIVLSAALLALFVLTVDISHTLDALAQADYLYVLPAVALYLIAVVFRTMRWQVLLRHMKNVSSRRLLPVVVVGYMANNILPMRLGELVRCYYLGDREGISKTASLATVFVERVLDALTLLFFVAVMGLFLPLNGLAESFGEWSGVAWPLLVLAFTAPFVGAFGGLMLFAFFPDRTRSVGVVLAGILPQRFEAFALRSIDYFLQGLIPLRSPKTLAVLLFLSFWAWLLEAGLFFLIGFSFDLHNVYDSLWYMAGVMILVTATANIGSSVPAAPGGIGLFELVARETLALLPIAAVDRSVAAGFAAVTHVVLLLAMIIPGQIFLWTEQVSLRRLTRTLRNDQPSDREGALTTTPLGKD